jgi:hypothetical protein
VLVLPCGGTTLVVQASWVEAIDDLTIVDGELRDAVALFGLEGDAALGSRSRRAIRLLGGVWLAVGHEVLLRALPASAFGPVPAWLGGLVDRAPIAALVRVEAGFGFEVDVARVTSEDVRAWA